MTNSVEKVGFCIWGWFIAAYMARLLDKHAKVIIAIITLSMLCACSRAAVRAYERRSAAYK